MKKIIGFLIVLTCFLNTGLEAISAKNFKKQIKSHYTSQTLKKSKGRAETYTLKKKFNGESITVDFPEEPNEFFYKLSKDTYAMLVQSLEDALEEDASESPLNTNYAALLPKKSRFFVTFDQDLGTSCFLCAANLRKGQDEAALLLSKLLTEWKQENEYIEEEEGDFYEENHFEYTPVKKNENGDYVTDFCSSSICIEYYDDDEDEIEKEYKWGKIVITEHKMYVLLANSPDNNPLLKNKALAFLSSFEVHRQQ